MLAFKTKPLKGYHFLVWLKGHLLRWLDLVNTKITEKESISIKYEKCWYPAPTYLIMEFKANNVSKNLLIIGDYMKYYKAQAQDNDNIKIAEDEIKILITENVVNWKTA